MWKPRRCHKQINEHNIVRGVESLTQLVSHLFQQTAHFFFLRCRLNTNEPTPATAPIIVATPTINEKVIM